jgi:aminopeptidase N
MTTALVSKKRLDYLPPSHTINTVDLTFDLSPSKTKVTSVLEIQRLDPSQSGVFLNGVNLSLESIAINEQNLTENMGYCFVDEGIMVDCSLDQFTLTIVNYIQPDNNTSLEGLYFSNNAFCTQCEAEGFRKITYFMDRPDVLATYTVTINTTRQADTYLLSNGNLIKDTGMVDGKRSCVWHDPFPKPCYLFALVAGHFDKLADQFITQSGRKVTLELFVDEGRIGQGQHALDSLKKAMRWDEQTYNLEYDLDIYMVVAVDFFNMGAMENKGLNVFNSKFVLADADTATDEDYFNIESIIAHEYFHNWTGNRVTCRDWFQLSLKEGLTVFRDQQFSADMYSDLVTRISQVNVMREHQFVEDAGPMSHPIRPDEVIEMNNFYTVTVYDKGAEVIRMLHTLLGVEGFRKGMDEYFARHDGQAVTCDDFVNAMQDANELDLSHFKLWYSQAGTPTVKVEQSSQGKGKTKLSFTQINKPTSGQAKKLPLYIPIKLECFTNEGEKIATHLTNDTLLLETATSSIILDVDHDQITPSLLQDFSAPVIIDYQYTLDQLLIIIEHASNDYAKWEGAQNAYIMLIKRIYAHHDEDIKDPISQLAKAIQTVSVAPEVHAQLLSVPSSEAISSQIHQVDPIRLFHARTKVLDSLSLALHDFCEASFSKLSVARSVNGVAETDVEIPYAYEKTQVNQRSLKNTCLQLMANTNKKGTKALIEAQYDSAHNMTDRLGALKAAHVIQDELFDSLMLRFEEQFGHDAVVMDKWFAMHAKSNKPDILAQLDLLQAHQQFSIKNPNKVRSVIGSFAFYNTLGFHKVDGSGYKYLGNYLIEFDKINPQVASRLITPLMKFSSYADHNKNLMKAQLQRLYGVKGLSKDLFEKISKALVAQE